MDWREELKQRIGCKERNVTERWQAVFVLTGHEDNIKEKIEYALQDTTLKAVVPKRCIMERKDGRWHEKIKPLFPGYILLQGAIATPEYYLLKSVPGIIRFLKDNKDFYTICPEEIEVINHLMCNGDLIGISTAYQQDDKIIIVEGPLLGKEGLIIAVDQRKGRARVKLSLLGDERTVDLSLRVIKTA